MSYKWTMTGKRPTWSDMVVIGQMHDIDIEAKAAAAHRPNDEYFAVEVLTNAGVFREMWAEGHLTIDTSDPYVPPAPKTIDQEVLRFLLEQ